MSEFWIQTFSGKKFDLLEPTLDMLNITDIAHHLSLENRYNGATLYPLSVAYHSINVCKNMPKGMELEGLLHDAHEAYYKDWTHPFKLLLGEAEIFIDGNKTEGFFSYNLLCYQLDQLLEWKFQINLLSCKNLIRNIDCRVGKTERIALNDAPEKWSEEYDKAEPFPINIMERNWRNVELEFLDLYEKYKRT